MEKCQYCGKVYKYPDRRAAYSGNALMLYRSIVHTHCYKAWQKNDRKPKQKGKGT